MMNAVVMHGIGGVDCLRLVQVARPKPAAGEAVVKMQATSVNPVDFKLRRGDVPGVILKLLGHVWPPTAASEFILGGDVCGTIEEPAASGSRFARGQRVFGLKNAFSGSGTYAEFVAAPESSLVAIPDKVTTEQAAGIPLAGLTALQALDRLPGDVRGRRILIHGGAGGVGSLAVQIAKARGMHVIATCGPRNVAFVTSVLGADEVIDYTSTRFEDSDACNGRCDAVLDTIGGDIELRSYRCVAPGGHFLSVLNSGWGTLYGPGLWGGLRGAAHWATAFAKSALGLGPSYALCFVTPSGPGMARLAAYLASGAVKAVLDRTCPLTDSEATGVQEAHAYLERGHARGKVVLAIAL